MSNADTAVFFGKNFTVFQHEHVIEGVGNRLFEYVYRVDGTRIIAINSSNQVMLTREFRHELNGFDWRLPGGKLDFPEENIIDAAARELLEETGVTANDWRYLWATSPDATIRFKRHFLIARDLKIADQQLGEGEVISVHWFPIATAIKMAICAEIAEEISAISILRYFYSINESAICIGGEK